MSEIQDILSKYIRNKQSVTHYFVGKTTPDNWQPTMGQE